MEPSYRDEPDRLDRDGDRTRGELPSRRSSEARTSVEQEEVSARVDSQPAPSSRNRHVGLSHGDRSGEERRVFAGRLISSPRANHRVVAREIAIRNIAPTFDASLTFGTLTKVARSSFHGGPHRCRKMLSRLECAHDRSNRDRGLQTEAGQRERDLLELVRRRVPFLRGEGLVTDRIPTIMRCRDGTIVEVSEWKSQAAIDAAHKNPNVLAFWNEMFADLRMRAAENAPGSRANVRRLRATRRIVRLRPFDARRAIR